MPLIPSQQSSFRPIFSAVDAPVRHRRHLGIFRGVIRAGSVIETVIVGVAAVFGAGLVHAVQEHVLVARVLDWLPETCSGEKPEGAVTMPVGALVCDADPPAFVAVTVTSIVSPTSALWTV